MARSYTETVGMINNVIAHLSNADNAAKLTQQGFAVAARKERMTQELATITQANAEQEKRKVAAKQQTELLDEVLENGYNDASGAIDSIADAYGKGSDAARNVLRIRSAIRRGPLVAPPPAPAAPAA